MRLPYLLTPYALKHAKSAPKTVSLENIRVAAPCPASWEEMNGDDRVRHCAECKLNVYNLSDMTRAEAEELIASREGRLCVRFYRRADGTILTRDCPKELRQLIRRVSRVAGAALSAMIAVGTVFAQSDPKACPQTANHGTQPKDGQLTLTVVDPVGAVIAGAKIQLTNKRTGVQFAGKTRSDGVGFVSGVAPGDFVLRIESGGFKTYQTPITIKKDKMQPLRIVLQVAEVTVGVLVETSPPLVDRDSATVKTTFSGELLQHLPIR